MHTRTRDVRTLAPAAQYGGSSFAVPRRRGAAVGSDEREGAGLMTCSGSKRAFIASRGWTADDRMKGLVWERVEATSNILELDIRERKILGMMGINEEKGRECKWPRSEGGLSLGWRVGRSVGRAAGPAAIEREMTIDRYRSLDGWIGGAKRP